MSSAARKYKVSVFGDSYTLVSDETEEHVLKAVSRVDLLMQDIAQRATVLDSKRIAVLVALQIASSLAKAEEKIELDAAIQVRLHRLLDEHVDLNS